MFSLRLGVAGRVGDLEGEPNLTGDRLRPDPELCGLVFVGVIALDPDPGVTGLDGDESDVVVVEAVLGRRSERELRRFRRTLTGPFVDIPLIEEDMDPVCSCPLPGRAICS